MRHVIAAACVAGVSAATMLPTFAAEIRGHAIPTVAAAHAAELTRLPNMSAAHSFTVITKSKDPASIATLSAYFKTFGFGVSETPGRHNLILRGTYQQAASSAHFGYAVEATATERYVRASTPLAFPAKIAALIKGTSFVPGLHAHSLAVHPLATTWGPATGYGPADVAAIYDINPLYRAGITGKGVKVAIAACSTVNPADLAGYAATFGLPAAKIHFVPVDGTTTFEDGEAVLDAERVYGTAPGAEIYEYLAPDCLDSEITDMFAQIAEDDTKFHFAAVSHSYGLDEADYAYFGVGADLIAEDAALSEIADEHVPVFVASGDGGSWGDLAENETDVSFPSSDPAAISVGGTTVEENAIGLRLFEYAWEGSGGGVSDIFPIPGYQKGQGAASGQYKNLPDVAMLADPDTGAALYWANNIYGEPPLFAIGGTSVAAPTFAGSWVLVNAVRAKAGLAYITNTGASIYGARAGFTDITIGTNGYYPAQKGVDNVTGLGVPDVTKLAGLLY